MNGMLVMVATQQLVQNVPLYLCLKRICKTFLAVQTAKLLVPWLLSYGLRLLERGAQAGGGSAGHFDLFIITIPRCTVEDMPTT